MAKKELEKVRCSVCGRIYTARIPKGGDGTFLYPRRHQSLIGNPCKGNLQEAEYLNPYPTREQ